MLRKTSLACGIGIAAASAAVGQTFSIDRDSPSWVAFAAMTHFPDSLLMANPASVGEDAGGFGPAIQYPGNFLPRHFAAASPPRDIDAFSTNHGDVRLPAGWAFRIYFSVRRDNDGDPGTAVHAQFLNNQEAGDVYMTKDRFRPIPPGAAVKFGASNTNGLAWNQNTLDEVPTAPAAVFIPPTPRIDDLDALDFGRFNTDADPMLESALYYSVSFATDPGFSADIWVIPPGLALPLALPTDPGPIYARRDELGLITGDDIDGLVVFDKDNNFVFSPGDAVLLSLARGSTSLGAGFPYFFGGDGSQSDVFMVYKTGPAVGNRVISRLAQREDLGFNVAVAATSDVDALEVRRVSVVRADLNGDLLANFNDIDPLVLALISPEAFEEAYPDASIENADFTGDGSVRFDDIDGFVECLVQGGCDGSV